MVAVMAGMELTVERVDWAVRVEFWWRLAIGLVTIAVVAAAFVYGSAPSPGSRPAPALRTATEAQVAGLTSVLATDWSRVRSADHAWFAGCYDAGTGGTGPSACAGALHRQVTALQRLQRDVGDQRLAGTQLGAIVDGRFLHSVTAALTVKQNALALLTTSPPGRSTPMDFLRQDVDPVLCIGPVDLAIHKATGSNASRLFPPYPLSNGYFPISGRGSCPAAPPVT
jgi:hypothetical protein